MTAKVLTYFEKIENSVLRMVNQELFGFLLNYILHRPEPVGQTADGTP